AWLVFRMREPRRGSADLLAAVSGTVGGGTGDGATADDGTTSDDGTASGDSAGGAAGGDGLAPAAGAEGADGGLFRGGLRQFTVDMLAGLRADIRTIMQIRTMRYALVGVAALLFT